MKQVATLGVLLILLSGCTMPEEEQLSVAQSTCSILSAMPGDAASQRIKEINSAREKIGKVNFTGRDETIRDAIKYGVCAELVLDKENFSSLLNQQVEVDKRQQQKRINTAIYTCNVMGETRNMDAAFRIKELNSARIEIGGSMYLGTDEQIKESFNYGLCLSLVLEDSYEKKLEQSKELERVAAAKKAQEENIAREKAAEERRIAAAKKVEQDKIERKMREEAERIAAKKKAEADRIAAEELARVVAEYRTAANKELSKYQFFITTNSAYDSGLSIYPDNGSIYLTIQYRTTEGMIASFDDFMVLDLESVTIDFKDPEIPDFVNTKNSIGFNLDFTMGGRQYGKSMGSGERQFTFDRENRLSRDQRAFFVRKFGTGESERVYPPKSAFTVIMKITGIRTLSTESFEFECENFDLLKTKDLCSSSSFGKRAEFKDPIEIRF